MISRYGFPIKATLWKDYTHNSQIVLLVYLSVIAFYTAFLSAATHFLKPGEQDLVHTLLRKAFDEVKAYWRTRKESKEW